MAKTPSLLNTIIGVILLPLVASGGMASAQTAPSKKADDPGAAIAKALPVPPADAPPLPATLSEKARLAVSSNAAANPDKTPDLAKQRAFIDQFQQTFGALQRKKYKVDVAESTIAGVSVRWITPPGVTTNSKRILINLHGGGFVTDSGSLTENIPIAALTGTPVVAVRYRLAPENLFPAQVDDALAVYRELLKTHKPGDIGIYGTSAGAVLGPELLMRIRAEGLPMPAMLGVFSGDLDLSRRGDSVGYQKFNYDILNVLYLGNKTLATDPRVSPLLSDLNGFPPTMCMTSSRDFFLSSTSNFCLGLEKLGIENKLVAFDGLPHAFWSYIDSPESDQAFEIQARWLKAHFK